MDQNYFLKRKRAELALAQRATNSVARLLHYDLAGQYSVRAAGAASEARLAARAVRATS